MPTSGTHVTIVQRLALDPRYRGLLGDPDPVLAVDDPEAIKMRFACFGSCGPDFLYALGDFESGPLPLQDLENILVKIAGTFSCGRRVFGQLGDFVDGVLNDITFGVAGDLQATLGGLQSAALDGLIALLVKAEVNPFALITPKRQVDRPRENWFWADYLHYIRTGRFANALLANCRNDPNLRAYSLGYLTHYITDVVGHPYVNAVTGGPFRCFWQRHHLVENFIDAYTWPRWHDAVPEQGAAGEPLLDRVRQAPQEPSAGPPYLTARINDWINIGESGGIDPITGIVEGVCGAITTGAFNLGLFSPLSVAQPPSAQLDDWAKVFRKSMLDTYTETALPNNLGKQAGRIDGFPTEDDLISSYSAFRLLMLLASEDAWAAEPPPPPNIAGDLSKIVDAVAKAMEKVAQTAGQPPSAPSGSFSLAALFEAFAAAIVWLGKVLAAVADAIWAVIKGLIQAAGTLITAPIRYGLWVIQRALWALMNEFRNYLVLHAISTPRTEMLGDVVGPLDLRSLWTAPAGSPSRYPLEEDLREEMILGGGYHPALPFPVGWPLENPAVSLVSPYRPGQAGESTTLAPGVIQPDDFIDSALGPTNLFDRRSAVLETAAIGSDMGGAMANCRKALDEIVADREITLPDYNLDGDRGYGWPTWDIEGWDAGTAPPLNPATAPGGQVSVPAEVVNE